MVKETNRLGLPRDSSRLEPYQLKTAGALAAIDLFQEKPFCYTVIDVYILYVYKIAHLGDYRQLSFYRCTELINTWQLGLLETAVHGAYHHTHSDTEPPPPPK